jgi:hypothetical protein
MDVVSLFVANAESALVEQPREGGFDHVKLESFRSRNGTEPGISLGHLNGQSAVTLRSPMLKSAIPVLHVSSAKAAEE